jgi:hypothetical protein
MPVPSSAVATFRDQWATRFVDAITFTRVTDRGTFNDATLVYDTPTVETIFTGACLVRPVEEVDTDDFGEQEITSLIVDVFMPFDAGDFQLEDLGTITAVTWDTDLDGVTMTVVEVEHDTYLTRKRVRCVINLGAGFAG